MCAINKTAGLEDGSIGDDQITSSSRYGNSDDRAPWNARLNNEATFWAAANNRRTGYHWLQIDFVNDTIIKGIRTQGSLPAQGQWVRSLEIETGDDEDILYPIQVNGSIVVSTGHIQKSWRHVYANTHQLQRVEAIDTEFRDIWIDIAVQGS